MSLSVTINSFIKKVLKVRQVDTFSNLKLTAFAVSHLPDILFFGFTHSNNAEFYYGVLTLVMEKEMAPKNNH